MIDVKVIEIPFVTKKNSKYSISGIAFYVIDAADGHIIYELPFLKSGKYRPMDENIRNTKGYWSSSPDHWKTFRESVLPEEIYNKEANVLELNQWQILDINNFAKNGHLNNVLSLQRLISGSNPSGSETNVKNSPFFFSSTKSQYLFYNFINPLNKIKKSVKDMNLNHFKKYPFTWFKTHSISLDEYLILYPKVKEIFLNYNLGLSESTWHNKNIREILKNKDFNFKASDEHFFNDMTIVNIKRFDANIINENSLKNALCNIANIHLELLIMHNYLSNNFILNSNNDAEHNIYIKNIDDLIENQKYKDIADPNNIIRVDKETYDQLIANDYHFDPKEKCLFLVNKPNIKYYLNPDVLTAKRLGNFKWRKR